MLKENKKLDIDYILKDLDKYKLKWRGWVWREYLENFEMGFFKYKDCIKFLKKSVGLLLFKYFNNIDF